MHLRSIYSSEKASCNYGLASWVPGPVRDEPGNVTDIVGCGWEMTSSVFKPLPDYIQSKLYPGYSFDFL
jgi:hypothetical protein